MSGPAYDIAFLSQHPAVHVVIGKTRSGKTTYMNRVLQYWRWAGRKSLAIDLVAPDPPLPKHLAHWADYWMDRAPDKLPGDVSLVACDEWAALQDQSGLKHPVFKNLIFRGQHQNLSLGGVSALLGTQRPSKVDANVLSQARRWTVFRLTDSNDLRYLKDHLPGEAAKIIPHLPNLEPGWGFVVEEDGQVWAPRLILPGGG